MTMPEVYLPRTNNRKHTTTAWDLSPTSLQFGVQPGNEGFFEKIGFEPTLACYGKRKPRPMSG
jgi:hypothetical protein